MEKIHGGKRKNSGRKPLNKIKLETTISTELNQKIKDILKTTGYSKTDLIEELLERGINNKENNSARLYHGDCLEIMKSIKSKSVNLIICDLPYGKTKAKWDVKLSLKPLWDAYKRIITDNGVIILFGAQPFSSELIMSNQSMFKYQLVWTKNSNSNFVHAKNTFLKKHEDILVFSKGSVNHQSISPNRMVYNPQGLEEVEEGITRNAYNRDSDTVFKYSKSHRDTVSYHTNYPGSILYFPLEERKKRFHSTQKPVALLEYLIKTYSHEGDLVLDNCMGSGSTGVAARNVNRQFIGIEKDDKFFKIANERLNN